MSEQERIVFDTEPLVAHADDEPGSDAVEDRLNAVSVDDMEGYVNYVNLSETRYVLARKSNRETADEYISWLLDIGMKPVDAQKSWEGASEFILNYNPALGDSFALSTAEELDAELLVGPDDDYDDVADVSITRFRDESV
jgi:predicted nucleic acid-binding protein